MTDPPPDPPPDQYAPVDYPANYPPLPPPVYPAPPYPPTPGYPYPAGYPGYAGNPYDPYRLTKPPGTNGKAITALVLSLAGLAFCGLTCIPGIILGIIAMRETKRTGQDGFGLAVAGVAVGAVIIAIGVAYIVFMIAVIGASSHYSTY